MPNLDAELMARLSKGLLMNMGWRTPSLLKKKLQPEANLAFDCFCAFFNEVDEFKSAVGEVNPTDLQFSLKLHKRIHDENLKAECVHLARTLAGIGRIGEWRELVKESGWEAFEKFIGDDSISKSDNTTIMHPPQG